MDDTEDKRAVRDILMCVIGEALIQADASFMFGHDFSSIIEKYAPLLKKTTATDKYIHADFEELRGILDAINDSQPFLGASYQLVQDKIDSIENEIYK
jgi:sialic acid synthase SpsE